MATSVTYTGNGSNSDFEITFSYARIEDLNVYVDDVLTTYWSVSGTTLTIEDNVGDPNPPANGISVLIERATDVTQPVTTFSDGSVYIADGLNNQVTQILNAIEEVNDKIDNLPAGGGGGGASNVPNATAGNQFIASSPSGSHAWTLKSVADVQSLLGISGANSLPAAVADRFLTTQVGSATYELQSPATVKARLGIGASIPTPSNQSNYFMTTNGAGNAYQLSPVETVKSNLGLGSAAYRNTGTASGNIPLLVAPAAGNVGALPVISGENLTNIQKPVKFMVYQVMVRTNPTTTRQVPVSSAAVPWLSTTTSAVIEKAIGCQNMLDTDPWISTLNQTPDKWNLRDAGLYRIQCEQLLVRLSGSTSEEIRMRLELPDDSQISEPEFRHWSWTETRPFWLRADTNVVDTIIGEWTIRTNSSNQAFWFEVRKSSTTASNVQLSRANSFGAGDNIDYLGSVVKIWKMG